MPARHAVTAGEVGQVLYGLEQEGRLMADGDDVYLTA